MNQISILLADIFDLHPKKTPLSRSVNTFIYVVIVLSTIAVILETIASLAAYKPMLESFESVVLAVFLVELLLRLAATPEVFRRHQAIGERITILLYYLVDILAILPPIILLFDQEKHFDYFTSLRLLRMFKLFRHDHSVEFIVRAIMKKRTELVKSAVLVAILTLFMSVLLYEVENNFQIKAEAGKQVSKFSDILTALIWSLDMFMDETSGYGEFRPITSLGKVIAGFIGFMKIGIVIIPTGIIASGFIEVIAEEQMEEKYDLLCAAFRKKYNEELCDDLYEQPHTLLTVKNALNITDADFYKILEKKNGFRIRSVLSSASERYNDTNLLEFFGYGEFTAYGVRHIEPSAHTLVCPNNFEDKGMSYFAYVLSVALKSDIIFNEKYRRNSMNPAYDYNFLHTPNYFNFSAAEVIQDKKALKNMRKQDKAFFAFMTDLRLAVQKRESKAVVMLTDPKVATFTVRELAEQRFDNDLLTWLYGLQPQGSIVVTVNPELPDRDPDIALILEIRNEVLRCM
jgi:voltage-gated potassium channel